MKLDKLLIIHPSRGRPQMALDHANMLMRNMAGKLKFHYVFSLDCDDRTLPKYAESLRSCVFSKEIIIAENKGIINAINRAAAQLDDEDMIFNMSDDIASIPGWDARLKDFVEGIPSPEYLVLPVDMDNGENVPVIQMMSAALYRRLGYLIPDCYDSMYADNDLLESCKLLNVVFACRGLGFEHLHPNYGKGQWDETYARENRPEAYASGLAMLERRRAEKFGLKI